MSSSEISNVSTLIELLYLRAWENPEQPAYTFLHDSQEQNTSLTYGELVNQVNAIAIELCKQDLQGQRALILYPSNLDFLIAFLACMSAGVIAVPAYPPRKNQNMERIKAIVNDCEPATVLATTKIMEIAQPILQEVKEFKNLKYFCTDNKSIYSDSTIEYPVIDSESLAFLQYTSGSTGDPKGVMLTHANLFYNQKLIKAAGGDCLKGNIVSWLPLFHDMGLGMALQSIMIGGHCSLMTPSAFIQKPDRWLWAIANDKAFFSGGPNFAYEHCLKMMRPELYEGLDLSCWKVAISGAEPVKASTMKKFSEVFGIYGYSSSTFMPSYGLAEATVAVTTSVINTKPEILYLSREKLSENKVQTSKENKPEGFDAYVSCGKTWFDDELIIVDPEVNQICHPDSVGEIWLKSKSIGKGYWEKDRINQEIFKAKVKGSNDEYLRTGDLGFVQNEKLFITGRKKDLIIIRGRNYYPQDIENYASSTHDALSNNFSATITADIEDEIKLILIHEVEREFVRKLIKDENLKEEIIANIREIISSEFELQVNVIVLLKPGSIPKTSSGKVQRQRCLMLYQNKDLEPILEWDSESIKMENSEPVEKINDEKFDKDIEGELEDQIENSNKTSVSELSTDYLSNYKEIKNWIENWISKSQKIKPGRIDIHKELTSYGMDSIEIMKMTGELSHWLKIELSPEVLWDYLTIHQLSEYLTKNKSARLGEAGVLNSIPVQNRGIEKKYPLSCNQERIWYLQQIDDDSQVYDIEGVYRINGELNEKALESAFDYLVNRHEAFSASFYDEYGETKQTLKTSKWDYKLESLNPSADSGDEKQVEQWLAEGRKDKFNLSEGALLKVRLLHASAVDNILQVRVHHIISDGWSLSIFVKELASCYEAFSQNQSPVLQPLSVQYMDYILWQKSANEKQLFTDGLKYWESRLKNVEPLELPTDFSRPPVQTYNGLHRKISLSRSMTEELKKLGQKENATLYNILLATFKILLYKYSGQNDICIGTPIANRTKADSELIVGMLVNTLPLRTKIEYGDSFLDVLDRVKTTTQEAYRYQAVSYSQIIDKLEIPRDLSRTPLFQTMFVMQNASISSEFKTSTIGLEEIEFESGTSKFDLTMEFVEDKGIINGLIEFNRDLFQESTIERLIGHYETLLSNILVEPTAPNSAYEILTSREKEFLNNCNKTQKKYDSRLCVHKSFENQVEKTPNNTAVEVGKNFLSYDELNKKANLVCSWLISKNIKISSKVGICIGKSINLMPAILGALKAGCTYVPLDPGFPEGRLEIMSSDIGLDAVISENGLFNTVPFENPVLDLVKDKERYKNLSADNKNLQIDSENLLYLIFTSGSTGKPKCAGVVHRSAMNLYTWYADEFEMDECDRCLVISAIGFDLTQKNLFTPLMVGAKVILPAVEEYDAEYLIKLIKVNKITWLNCAPSAFYPIIENPKKQVMLRSLEKVILGGESIQVDRIRSWAKYNKVKLINSYGPSECTDIAAYYRVNIHEIDKISSIPIGKANPNVQLYVVDKMLNQMPIGVPGELYIGGAGLGSGYYNNEKLTEEKFVANPFYEPGSGHSMRLYKSGDKVKRLKDGNIEFIGRFDHQVKLRGFRIEPGEIEAIINSFSEIKESAVKVCTNNKGLSVLVAYYVLSSEEDISDKEIKERLGIYLPDYMVPGIYMSLGEMPLTFNDKIDRSALPEIVEFDSSVEYVAPESTTEIKLESIWSDILDQKKIGIYDSFFDIGGHSLLATKIVSRAKSIFDVELSVKALFSEATIHHMAMYIDTLTQAKDDVLNGRSNDTEGRQEMEL